MSQTMQQVRLHGVQDVRLDQVAVPSAGPRDVLVKIDACGICGSDLGYVAKGGLMGPTAEPLPLGHEMSGVLTAVGAEVGDLRIGMRVVVNPDDNMIGNGGAEGAFAPYLLVRNARRDFNIYPIPEHVPPAIAALTEPLAVALHGVNRAEVQPHHKAVVFGAGSIGLGVIVGLRQRGVTDIISVDMVDSRLQLARQLGAKTTINPSREDFGAIVAREHGTSQMFGWPMVNTDVFIDAAGAAAPLQQAVTMCRSGARFVIVAVHKQPVPLDLVMVMAKELVITGSIAYPRDEFSEVIAMLSAGKVDVSAMISHRFPLSDFPQAFKTAQDTAHALKVMVEMN
ncbi:MAG TPA: zinc-binding dehydrogenase [Spongiibacteraceae bacterium]|nr:zinc-binding dehydrogenase [Spongiibacteraceae bacterium]